MATRELTEQNFTDTIESSPIVLVDWWASWCGPCQAFAPVYDSASREHPDVVFGKIDTEAQADLAAAAGIRSIPTLMAFRDGILVHSQAGALPAAGLRQVIDAVRDLDMNDVRTQLASQAPGPEPT